MFREMRKAAGMTIYDVAAALGVTIASVSGWENGKCYPRAATLVKLADLYHCTVDELVRREADAE